MRDRPEGFGEDHHPGYVGWLIFVLALCIRLAVIDGTIGFHTPAAVEPASDSQIYMALANNLLDGRGYRLNGAQTPITGPLYVLFLAGLYGLFGDPAAVRLFQAVLGALGCLLMYGIGRRLFDHATGLLAATILGVFPLVVYLTGLHLTESLFLFLLLAAILQTLRIAERPTLLAATGLGGLIGLAALTRPLFIAFVPFLLAWTMGLWGVRSPLAYRVFGCIAVGAVLVIIPWTVRNYLVVGEVVPVQSNSGLMFWAGNNPHSDGGIVWPTPTTWTGSRPPDDGMYGWHDLGVAAANRRYTQTAIAWIRGHPRDYVRLLARKLIRLYGFTRAAAGENLGVPRAVGLFQAVFLGSAVAGLLLTVRQWRTLSVLLLLIIFTNVVTLLFSGGTRYTIPMVPSLVVLSAVAVVATARQLARAFRWDRVAVSG